MRKVVLDTNFLLIPFQFKVDIFSEISRICRFNCKLCIFEQSINELEKIIKGQSGKDKKAAQFALKLIKLKDIGIIKSNQREGYVDSLILNSLAEGDVVATQDSQLKKELLKKGSTVIILRQKKYLELIEGKLYK